MIAEIPRLRMIAGPNGAGKSTIKSVLRPDLLGIYINPDEIEKEIRGHGFLSLDAFGLSSDTGTVADFFRKSTLLQKMPSFELADRIRVRKGLLSIEGGEVDSYFASVLSDFIRQRLVDQRKSFTFESVMSSSDKIELLRKARSAGYRTYLYYIATEDPDINISRVKGRVKSGGHSVPEDKIISRYHRSLDLLIDAIKCTNRAYLFDNSKDDEKSFLVAEVTDGKSLQIKSNPAPAWFKHAVWDKIPH